MSWIKYSCKRLLMLIPVIIGITLILYFVISLSAGSPATMILGSDASVEQIQELERQMGLDKPIIIQYCRYMLNVCRGDFGTSWVSGYNVLKEFTQRFPYTLAVAVLATLWAVAIGIPVGIGAAVKQNGTFDYINTVIAMLLFSVPAFWLGIMAQILFCLVLHWLPSSGVGSLKHYVLPALILGANTFASMIRMARTSMLDVIKQDYIRTARAKGATESRTIVHHAVRNSLIPVITQVGISFAGAVGGAIVTETIFAIPGIGMLLLNAVKSHDIPVVMGTVIFVAVIVGIINLAIDLICAVIDPRIDLAS